MTNPPGAGAAGGGAQAERPACYRHPDRETYIRCGRCGRYICPDDMISASVGFQCPECVRAANKGVRQARTTIGGAVRPDAGRITYAIMAINLVIFLAVQTSNELLNRLVLAPIPIALNDEWYRLFTATFLHRDTLHIGLNMLVLFLFGRPLEAHLGRSRFIATYLICALGGSTASYLFNDPRVGSLGASGAVFGVIGALLVVERRFGSNPSGALIYLGILLLPGLLIDGIDWRGHLGGLVTGAALGAVFVYAPARSRTFWHVGVAALVVMVLVVAVAVRSQRIDEGVRTLIFGSAATVSVIPTGDNRCGELHLCSSCGPAYCHFVDAMNPATMNAKPTSRL